MHHFSFEGISKRKAQLERCPAGKGRVFFIVTLRRGATSRKPTPAFQVRQVYKDSKGRGERKGRREKEAKEGKKQIKGGRGRLKPRLEGRRGKAGCEGKNRVMERKKSEREKKGGRGGQERERNEERRRPGRMKE